MRPDEPETAPEKRAGTAPDRQEPERDGFADTAEHLPDRAGASPHLVGSPFDRATPPAGVPVVPPDGASAPGANSAVPAELMNDVDVDRFHERLRELQADFVDDPERAVRDAQRLLGEAVETLAEAVAERNRVLDEMSAGGNTEDLRVALRRYRSTLDRLLVV